MAKRLGVTLAVVVLLLLLSIGIYSLVFETGVPDPIVETAGVLPGSKVVTVSGEVERRDGQSPWRRARAGELLALEEELRTGAQSTVTVDVGGTAKVEVFPDSRFSVRDITETVAKVRLDHGRLSAEVYGRGKSKLRVETKGSDAVAEAEAGEFSMLSSGSGRVVVATRRGSVRLSAKNKTVIVETGQQSMVDGDRSPVGPMEIPTSLFLRVKRPKSVMQREKQGRIRGQTAPGAIVSVNGVRTPTDEHGEFSAVVGLEEGKNQIVVEAEDVLGRRLTDDYPEITVKSRIDEGRSKARWTGKSDEPAEVTW